MQDKTMIEEMLDITNALGIQVVDNQGNEKGFLSVLREIDTMPQEILDKVYEEVME